MKRQFLRQQAPRQRAERLGCFACGLHVRPEKLGQTQRFGQ